jgi:hypothetical protein
MSDPTIIILALLLFIAVLNGKDIAKYLEWLRFKIRTYFKQMQNNERYNYSNFRSREILGKQQRSLQRQQWQLDSSGRANKTRKHRVF